jgi:OmpA-OmpF porin, OOP family
MKRVAPLLLALLCLSLPAAAEQQDEKGCKDHPLFTRMPTYWIHNCSQKEFDAFEFPVAKAKTERVEGVLWKINYYPQASATSKPSELQILRNFENAATKLGGTVVMADKSRETMRAAKDGKEFWVLVQAEFTGKYSLTIVERKAMAQDIEANAAVFADGLKTTGHVAVYGILFDTGKADIKPESAQAIGEIAKLLKGDAALRLHVVGHTDSVGSVDSNLKLSEARAEAVLQALAKEHGIAAGRLRAFGNGPFAPVASNDAEEGRAKNRRVELVKQ